MVDDERVNRVHDAVANALNESGAMVTRVVVVAENINDAGERLISVIPSPDMRTWDVAGFLHYAQAASDSWIARSFNDD
jgi:hypothetical protein